MWVKKEKNEKTTAGAHTITNSQKSLLDWIRKNNIKFLKTYTFFKPLAIFATLDECWWYDEVLGMA